MLDRARAISSYLETSLRGIERRAVAAVTVATVLLTLAPASLAQDAAGDSAEAAGASSNADPQDGGNAAKSKGILPVPEYGGDLWSRSYLLGDLGGARSDLANKGIQWNVQFVQTLQSVVDGGRETQTKYGGTLDYNLTLDFDRMGLIPGGLLTFRAESRYGETVNGIAGPLLPVNLDGAVPLTSTLDEDIPFTITNLNYTQFLSEKLGVVVGKFDLLQGDYNEFASGRGVSQFMNFNLVTNAPGAYPAGYSALGGGFFVMPTEQITIYNYIFTTQDSSTTTGFDTLDEGWTWNSEAYVQYKLGELPGGLMGGINYSFDADFSRLSGWYREPGGGVLQASNKDDTWSIYFNGWQYLYIEDAAAGPVDITDGKQDLQGIGVFARLAFADEDTNPVKLFASIGLGGRGIIPGRDDDSFGVGYFYQDLGESSLTNLLGTEDNSQGVEAYYSLAVSPSTFLTADIQVLDSPSPGLDTSWVLGLRLKMTF